MSQVEIRSPKHCAQKGLHIRGRWVSKKLLKIVAGVLISLIAAMLVVYLMLRPSKPEFALRQADLGHFSVSPAGLLNSSLLVGFLSTNHNQRVGIHYRDIQVSASYAGQPIAQPATIPPYYQDRQDANTLTASLAASGLPVARYLGYQVVREQIATGRFPVTITLRGRVRWRVGGWTSGSYSLKVNCVALLALNPNNAPSTATPGRELDSSCSTSV